MAQPRRGLADTALSIGVDISPRIQRLYAPPAAWSHGYLWGADTVTIPDERAVLAAHRRDPPAQPAERRRRERLGEGVHARDRLADRGARDQRRAGRRASRRRLAPGVAAFAADNATKRALEDAGEEFGLTFKRGKFGGPDRRSDRARAADRGADRRGRSERLGRCASSASPPTRCRPRRSTRRRPIRWPTTTSIYNTGSWPGCDAPDGARRACRRSSPTAAATSASRRPAPASSTARRAGRWADRHEQQRRRQRLQRHHATGTTAVAPSSVITGAYPAARHGDRRPAEWLTAVPATLAVDGRLPTGDFFAAGLFPGAETSSATRRARRSSRTGPNTANTANGRACSRTTRCTARIPSASGRCSAPRSTGRWTARGRRPRRRVGRSRPSRRARRRRPRGRSCGRSGGPGRPHRR